MSIKVSFDQIFFTVDASTFEKFQTLFYEPLPETDKLRQLLRTKAPWELSQFSTR